MHADYLLAAATMAEAERRAAQRSRHGTARRRRRHRLARVARRIAQVVRRLDPLPPLEDTSRPSPPVDAATVGVRAPSEADTRLDRCA